MMQPFFQTPFKAACLSVLGASVLALTSGATTPAIAQGDTGLQADLRSGGKELFKTIIPSVIQITNGGAGSGYMIDKGGYAITNTHVTSPNTIFEIALYGDEKTGNRYRGVLVAEDAALDMALLKVEAPPDKIVPIKLADTSTLKVGDTVATCGSPGGSAGATSTSDYREGWLDFFNFNLGTLTEILPFENSMIYFVYQAAYGYEPFAPDYGTAVQYLFHVDSAINKGNSGGPAMNARGEAIGTNTWGYGSDAGVTENVGFSVPVNLLTRSAREILQYGRVRRPWLGVALHPPNPPQSYFRDAEKGLSPFASDSWIDPTPDRFTVQLVNSYAPAAKFLKKGDVILAVDGHPCGLVGASKQQALNQKGGRDYSSPQSLQTFDDPTARFRNIFDVYKYVLNKQVGDKITLHVERGGIGLPPMTITLDEKRNRYDNAKLVYRPDAGTSNLGTPGGARIFQITY